MANSDAFYSGGLQPTKKDDGSYQNQLMMRHLTTLEKVCDDVGDIVEFIRFGNDPGIACGSIMNVKIYCELFKPRHKIL